jgi:hypothetical protein
MIKFVKILFLCSFRLSASRELERNVKGYKELRKDLAQVI